MLAIFGPVALALVGIHAVQWGHPAGAGDAVGSQQGEIRLRSFATCGAVPALAITIGAERRRLSPAEGQPAASRVPPRRCPGWSSRGGNGERYLCPAYR